MSNLLADKKFTKALKKKGLSLKSEHAEYICVIVLADRVLEKKVGMKCHSFPMLTLKKAIKLAQEYDLTRVGKDAKNLIKYLDKCVAERGLVKGFCSMVGLGYIEAAIDFPYFCTDLIIENLDEDEVVEFAYNIQAHLALQPQVMPIFDWSTLGLKPSEHFYHAPYIARDLGGDFQELRRRYALSKKNSLAAVAVLYEFLLRRNPDLGLKQHFGFHYVTEMYARHITMGMIEEDLEEAEPMDALGRKLFAKATALGVNVKQNHEWAENVGALQPPEAIRFWKNFKDIYKDPRKIVSAQIEKKIDIAFSGFLILSMFTEGKAKTSLETSILFSWGKYISELNKSRTDNAKTEYIPQPVPFKSVHKDYDEI